MPRKPDIGADNVSALQRGFEVLDCFASARKPLGNGEVSQITGIPRATVSRLVATLVDLGHVRPAREGDKYELASGVVRLAKAFLGQIDIREYARPILRELAESTGGTCFLGVRDVDEMLIIESGRARSAIAVLGADVGTRMSIATSALGRAWLAAIDARTRETLIGRLQTQPGWSADVAAGLEAGLAHVWRTGHAISLGEWNPGTNAAAVPVATAAGEIVSINCGGPTVVLTADILCAQVLPRLVEAAQALANEIGGRCGLELMGSAPAARPAAVASAAMALAA